ncbi:YhfZ family protein [Vibrio sp. MA40-2]|uniref:YhfZ family protein n=1 Tax=Vibrio sp. MA40-2 TaxID=3391828 RepID=UPI0039A68869
MPSAKIIVNDDQAILNAQRCIVVHALQTGLNSKLLTNTQFLEKYGIVAGTIQRALNTLKKTEALTTRSKGHLGRIITEIDTGLCWNIAKLKPVQLLMPSSGSIEIDILIRNITNKLSRLNIPYFISNKPGGEKRISQVLSGEFDIALVSRGASENMQKQLSETNIKVLTPHTYYSLNRLVIVSRTKGPTSSWKKIAIDSNSSDHTRITKAEFPESEGFEYIETNFRQVPARTLKNEVDAGLWHMTSSPVPLELAGLRASILQNEKSIAIHEQLSAATFVTNPHRPELISLLNELDNMEIVQNQCNAFNTEDPYNKAFNFLSTASLT